MFSFHKEQIRTALNYVPGLIILIMSVLALLASISLIETHQHLDHLYEVNAPQLKRDPAFVKEFNEILGQVDLKKQWLYGAIVAIGLAGFVLVVLNSDKLRQLEKINKKRQQDLQLLQSRLIAIEASFDGIAIMDGEGTLVYMNPAMMELYAVEKEKEEEFIGHNWLNLYSMNTRQHLEGHALLHMQEEGFWRDEQSIQRHDGKTIDVELSMTMLADGGYICAVRDATARRKAEREKEELQDQFYQAQKMEAIGRLAGGIAHDFNNILAAMNGYAEFLVEDLEEDSSLHGFASNILQAGRQARDLVDQMLAFSRQKASNVQSVDLSVSLKEVYSILDASMPKAIEIKYHNDINGVYVQGNNTQISQILMNLCVNAKDAMEDERGEIAFDLKIVNAEDYAQYGMLVEEKPDESEAPIIKIRDLKNGGTRLSLGYVLENRSYAMISVSDTGSGISRTVLEHIFEPFFTTKSVDKGTGLGLSTVHGVLLAHHGALLVNTKVGEGTRFDILLPIEEGGIDLLGGEGVRDIEDIDLSEVMILLVEDQEEVRDVTLKMLKRIGCDAESCETGLEALAVIRENKGVFDLIITDHNMPKMTGMELAYQVSLENPDLPFILLSGYSEKELNDIMEQNSSIYAALRKPVSKDILGHKIKTVLKQKIARKKNS